MVIKGLNEGKGYRKFDKKKYILDTTWRKKTQAKEDALKQKRRGFNSRVVPIKIGYAVYSRRKKK